MSQPLYQIDSEIMNLLYTVGEDGEIDPCIAAELDNLTHDRQYKIMSICQVIRDSAAREAGIQAELDRLQMMKRCEERKQDWLKQYVKRSMEAAGEQRIEAGLFRLRIQRNSQPSVMVSCVPESLPDWAQVHRVEVNRKELLQRFKDTGALPAGVDVVYGDHLRIS